MACVQSPLRGAEMVVVGMPPNIASVQEVGSSGCALFHSFISWDIPT